MTLIKSISGIRGTIGGAPGEALTPVDIVKFVYAYCVKLKERLPKPAGERYRVVVGKDARISGEMVEQLVCGSLIACGVDVIKATVDVFENKEPVYEIHHSNKVVVNEFVYAKPGEFSCVKGFDECVQEGLLVSYDVLHHAGDTISGVQSSGDRVVAMTYVADSQQDYVEKHNKVVECIKIEDSYHNNILQYDFLPRM